MRRDMDLVREILRKTKDMPFWRGEASRVPRPRDVEDHRDTNGTLDLAAYLELEDYSSEQISFHVKIMAQAGLVETIECTANNDLKEYAQDVACIPTELTWQGCEFLEAVNDNDRWEKIKSTMAKAGGFVFELAKPLAIDLMKGQISSLLSQSHTSG